MQNIGRSQIRIILPLQFHKLTWSCEVQGPWVERSRCVILFPTKSHSASCVIPFLLRCLSSLQWNGTMIGSLSIYEYYFSELDAITRSFFQKNLVYLIPWKFCKYLDFLWSTSLLSISNITLLLIPQKDPGLLLGDIVCYLTSFHSCVS